MYKIYEGNDYGNIYEVLSTLKNNKLKKTVSLMKNIKTC